MAEKQTLNSTNEALLQLDDKGTSAATGMLSSIFRKILAELNMNPTKWNLLMGRYLNDPRNRVPRNSRSRSSTRGNLNKELTKPKMTWQNFEKGIRFLNPRKARFIVKLTWSTGKTSTHEIGIDHIGEEPIELNEPLDEHAVVEPPIDPSQYALLKTIGFNPFVSLNDEHKDCLKYLENEGYILEIHTLGEKDKGLYHRNTGWALTEQGHNLIDQFG